MTGEAVGTIEGFGGETGVLRVDIARDYEKAPYLSEIFVFSEDNFHELYGNEYLVTKAVSKAEERRQALLNLEWEYIDIFRGYQDYYQIKQKPNIEPGQKCKNRETFTCRGFSVSLVQNRCRPKALLIIYFLYQSSGIKLFSFHQSSITELRKLSFLRLA